MKKSLLFVVIACVIGCIVSPAFAASTMKRAGENPFYRPPLTSEADLRVLVKSRSTQIKTGFSKAGYPDLYPAFSEQFPTVTINPIKVSTGETFKWMLFRKKGSGPVIVTRDVTWVGKGTLDAYRFYIDSKGKRYELVVLRACGNFALKDITGIPAPIAAAPEKAEVVTPAPEAVNPAPMPITQKQAEIVPPLPVPAAPEAIPPAPVAAVPDAIPPTPMPAAKFPGGLVLDTGFSYQVDPASYVFARIGYEFPLFDKLSLLAFVGGYSRIHGEDGGSAFIADAILDYHWWNRLSFGLGAGFWSGNDGQMDLIANLGFFLFGNPNSFNGTLFLEARSEVGALDRLNDQGRIGLGMRFRF
jgi:hypothetical protein